MLVGLADRGYPFALVYPPGINLDSLICPGAELIDYPMFKTALLYRQNRRILLERLEKFKPSVLHCCCSNKAGLVKYVARKMNIPYVITFNAACTKLSAPSVSSSHCGALVGSSESIVANLTRNYSRLAERTEHINIGVFVEDTCACFSDPARLASIVIAQPLDNSLNFESLLSAIRHLAIDGYEFVLAIIILLAYIVW